MEKPHRIFVINPGSSSTKVALYEGREERFSTTIRHDGDLIRSFPSVYDQLDFRYEAIMDIVRENGIDLSAIDAVAARAGFLKPVSGGTFSINEDLLDDLRNCRYGEHGSNISPFCAKRIADLYGIPAYVTNPVSVDEFMPESYMTGLPEIRRTSRFHALNHKAVAGYAAERLGKRYEEANIIVAHLGGGISIAAHERGRVVDACSPADEGPMSIDRPGQLPNTPLVRLCYSGKYTEEELIKLIETRSGVLGYTGLTDLIQIEERAARDPSVALVLDTMAYRIAFYIAGYSATLKGDVDTIVLTGGMARSDYIIPRVSERVAHIAPITLIKGEFEMLALAEGAIRVLSGQEAAKTY